MFQLGRMYLLRDKRSPMEGKATASRRSIGKHAQQNRPVWVGAPNRPGTWNLSRTLQPYGLSEAINPIACGNQSWAAGVCLGSFAGRCVGYSMPNKSCPTKNGGTTQGVWKTIVGGTHGTHEGSAVFSRDGTRRAFQGNFR